MNALNPGVLGAWVSPPRPLVCRSFLLEENASASWLSPTSGTATTHQHKAQIAAQLFGEGPVHLSGIEKFWSQSRTFWYTKCWLEAW